MSATDESDLLALIDEIECADVATDAQLSTLLACLGHARKLVQRRAAQAFAQLQWRRSLIATLASNQASQRWGAAYALSLQDPPALEATDVLVECLGSKDGDVRWAARDILMRWQQSIELGERLIDVALHGSPEQRKMAAYSLRDLRTPPVGAEQVSLRLLEDDDPGVRIAAMACLQKIATSKGDAATGVARLLSDADAGVRRVAAATLGSIGHDDDTIRAALEEASRSEDLSLRRAAEGALRKLSKSA